MRSGIQTEIETLLDRKTMLQEKMAKQECTRIIEDQLQGIYEILKGLQTCNVQIGAKSLSAVTVPSENNHNEMEVGGPIRPKWKEDDPGIWAHYRWQHKDPSLWVDYIKKAGNSSDEITANIAHLAAEEACAEGRARRRTPAAVGAAGALLRAAAASAATTIASATVVELQVLGPAALRDSSMSAPTSIPPASSSHPSVRELGGTAPAAMPSAADSRMNQPAMEMQPGTSSRRLSLLSALCMRVRLLRTSAVTRQGQEMPSPPAVRPASVRFSHVHIYADSLRPVEEIKGLSGSGGGFDLPGGRALWTRLAQEHGSPVTGERDPEAWSPSAQDVVEQLLVGLGWRVTGACTSKDTRSVLVTSPDPDGVKVVVTAHAQNGMGDLRGSEHEGSPAKRAKAFGSDPVGRETPAADRFS
ncbi:unnamed protein product [Prorocentrum cordatum]|uniref:Uncharacterized protein n=1 Tax=Prorocentrum cordatum TaxID=2364126 RepID=A0ABN9TDM5_9DINO|nr:unnamed protein product [Polarella glacialis]